jgi:hypothetical protein
MTVRTYRRTAQTETEDRNCTETSKQARNTQEKSQRKNVPKTAHEACKNFKLLTGEPWSHIP